MGESRRKKLKRSWIGRRTPSSKKQRNSCSTPTQGPPGYASTLPLQASKPERKSIMNDDLRVPLRYSGQDRQWPRSKPVFTVLALSLALVTGAGEFAFQYKTSWTALQRYYLSTYVQTAHLVETRNRYPRPSRTYRILRHPGYGAMIFVMPVTAIALGSRLALAPALLYSALIIRRTMEEDHFLKSKLPGYVSYAGRVRYRLFPGSLMKGGFDHAMSQMPLRRCRHLILAWFIGLLMAGPLIDVFVASSKNPDALLRHDFEMFAYIFSGLVTFILTILWAHNHVALPRRREVWNRSFMCQHCREIFL